MEIAVIDQIKRTPALKISFEGWLSLLLTIFIFLFTVVSSHKFESRLEGKVDALSMINERILESQQRLYEALLQHMQSMDATQTVYVTVRTAVLRDKPSPKSSVRGVISRNQLVVLESRKSKWIRVSYFDYVGGNMQIGWVLKKYLKMAKR